VLSEMHVDPMLNQIPVLVLSSTTSQDDQQRCLRLGAARVFQKPVSITDYDTVALQVVDFVRTAAMPR